MVNFTLPAQLRSFFLGPHAAKAFDVFFKTSSTALSQALANPKWLGAQVNGFTGILHTWNQQLLPHPHIHYIVPGAGLDAHGRLVRCKHQNFLLPTSELTRLFIAHWKQQLKDLQWDVDPEVWNKKWGVYIKAFGTGTHAVKYLGAYVSRTAIGDSRILEINDETVRFSWKDRSDGDKLKQLSLKIQSADNGHLCAWIQKYSVFRIAQLRLTPFPLWIAERQCQKHKDIDRPGRLCDPNLQPSTDPSNPSST